jgi:hypothetical protein
MARRIMTDTFGAAGNAVDSPANRARGAGNSTARGVSSQQPRTQTEGKARAPGAVGTQRLNHMHSGQPGGGSHHAQGGNSQVTRPTFGSVGKRGGTRSR